MGRGYDVHVALASRTGVAVVELILRARRSLLAVVPIELCVRERVERALRMPMRMRAHTSRCGERAEGRQQRGGSKWQAGRPLYVRHKAR